MEDLGNRNLTQVSDFPLRNTKMPSGLLELFCVILGVAKKPGSFSARRAPTTKLQFPRPLSGRATGTRVRLRDSVRRDCRTRRTLDSASERRRKAEAQ